jgi:hypothetical protein
LNHLTPIVIADRMSDHILPDDLSLWPVDPFEILGVGRDVDQQDARRKYLRLVRRFKPEHRPDAFQRLREAFDQVQQFIQWRGAIHDDWEEDAEEEGWTAEESAGVEREVPSLHEPAATSRSTPRQDPLEEAWVKSGSGNLQAAYQNLLSLRFKEPKPAEVCLRLYWLLLADPRLDQERSPRDWLVEGLIASRLSNRLGELYRRELLADPIEAATGRCTSLLDCTAEPFAIMQLLRWRWQGLFRASESRMIVADVERLRQRFMFDNEQVWARILMLALDHLAWSAHEDLETVDFDKYRNEIIHYSHHHHELDAELDRVDEITLLSADWQRLRSAQGISREWIDLIPYEWINYSELVTPTLMVLLQEVIGQPVAALQKFDQVKSVSSIAMSRIVFLIQGYCRGSQRLPATQQWHDMEKIVFRFLASNWSLGYPNVRGELLNLCISYAISPKEICQASETWIQKENAPIQWSQELNDDLSMRAVYLAHEAFEM